MSMDPEDTARIQARRLEVDRLLREHDEWLSIFKRMLPTSATIARAAEHADEAVAVVVRRRAALDERVALLVESIDKDIAEAKDRHAKERLGPSRPRPGVGARRE